MFAYRVREPAARSYGPGREPVNRAAPHGTGRRPQRNGASLRAPEPAPGRLQRADAIRPAVRAALPRGTLGAQEAPVRIDPGAGLAGALTAAHEGVAATQAVHERWNLDPELLVPAALLTALYLRGLYVWRDRSRPHPRWRSACYLLGVAVLVLAIESPLDALAEHHFSMHMVQHELLVMFAAPLILLGAPTTPVLRGLPRAARRALVRPLLRRRAARALWRIATHWLTAAAAFTALMWAWHLAPGWYDLALEDDLVHDLQHASFTAGGLLVWWNVIDPAPLRSRLGYVARMGLLLAVSTPKAFLGALIAFNESALYGFYQSVEPILALTPAQDQEIGGLIMWVPSQMMFLIAAGVVFAVWAHKAEQRQRAEDDARLAAARAGAGGG